MRTNQFSVLAGLMAMMLAMVVSLTGCDKNDSEVNEYLSYPWYVDPDTTRADDGKLYFHTNVFISEPIPNDYEEPSFIEEIGNVSVNRKAPNVDDTYYLVTQAGHPWSFEFNIRGEKLVHPKTSSSSRSAV